MPCLVDCKGNLYESVTKQNTNKVQCKSCGDSLCVGCNDEIIQRIIWKQVRVPTSVYTSVNKIQHVNEGINLKILNWNQSSDRLNASVQKVYYPTSARPGSQSPGGIGVDIKHNSFDRYISRKKSNHLKTETIENTPIKGNKKLAYGMLKCLCN